MNTEELFAKWKVVYDTLASEEDESVDELHYFDVAVGFCLSHGVRYEDAIDFYHGVCVPRNVF